MFKEGSDFLLDGVDELYPLCICQGGKESRLIGIELFQDVCDEELEELAAFTGLTNASVADFGDGATQTIFSKLVERFPFEQVEIAGEQCRGRKGPLLCLMEAPVFGEGGDFSFENGPDRPFFCGNGEGFERFDNNAFGFVVLCQGRQTKESRDGGREFDRIV